MSPAACKARTYPGTAKAMPYHKATLTRESLERKPGKVFCIALVPRPDAVQDVKEKTPTMELITALITSCSQFVLTLNASMRCMMKR